MDLAATTTTSTVGKRSRSVYSREAAPPPTSSVCLLPAALNIDERLLYIIARYMDKPINLPRLSPILGGRSELYISGSKAQHFISSFAPSAKQLPPGRHAELKLVFTEFISSVKSTITAAAKETMGICDEDGEVIISEDILILRGAPKEQIPHIDLIEGQFQCIVALTPAMPTLVLDDQTPLTVDDAFERLQIDKSSTSRYANVLRFAPDMALGRDTLLTRMVPFGGSLSENSPEKKRMTTNATATNNNNGNGSRRSKRGEAPPPDEDEYPREQRRWPAGSVFIADHTVVHSGPNQPKKEGETAF